MFPSGDIMLKPNEYTYLHNWFLQQFSQDYDLASHIIQVVCINFIQKWWDLQLKIVS